MKLQRALCNYLQQHFPSDVHKEPWCTCGSPNHVRMLIFRIDGWPATVFVPEGCELTAAQLGRAIPGARVESVTEAELDAVYLETELGRMQPFDNAFGAAVYMDHNLTHFDTLVFLAPSNAVLRMTQDKWPAIRFLDAREQDNRKRHR